MPSCPHCRSTGHVCRTCYADQKCVVCHNICQRFAVLECGHLICVDCARKMKYDIIGSMSKPVWELSRSYDGVTGKVTHIENPLTGRKVSIKTPTGRNALAIERKQRLQWIEDQRVAFRKQNRPRSSSPPAARGRNSERESTPIVIRSESPVRHPEAMMVEPNIVIEMPWDADYAAAFNRGVRERLATHTEMQVEQHTTDRIDTRRHRRTRLDPEGKTTESGGGVGRYNCHWCGRRVEIEGELCDPCGDLQGNVDSGEDQDDVTDVEILTTIVDSLKVDDEAGVNP